MTAKFLIRKEGRRTVEEAKARVYVRFKDGRRLDVTVQTRLTVNPLWWDEKREEIKTKVICPVEVRYGVAEHLRSLRNAIETEYEKTDRAKVDKSWLETVIDRHYNPEKYLDEVKVDPQDFSALFDEYTLRHKVSDVRAKNNQVLKRAVMRFELFRRLTVKGQKAYTFNVREVTPAILGELWEFFADEHKHFDTYPKIYAAVPEKRKPKPRGENAIIDMFSRLRTFFNWCLDSGYIMTSPFRQFSVPEPVYGTPVYITAEELRQIADFDFSNRPALAVQRDIFVFQCCVGCRIGDLYRMTWSNVEGDVFDYVAGKTKDDNPKTISVPLVTMAKKILKRYESSGRATILPFISEQKYNDAIKEVFRLAGINRVVTVLDPTTRREVRMPISECASSHMARRTFCGNLYKRVKDPNIVASMSGHKEGSKAFARYRVIDKDIKRDALKVFEAI